MSTKFLIRLPKEEAERVHAFCAAYKTETGEGLPFNTFFRRAVRLSLAHHAAALTKPVAL